MVQRQVDAEAVVAPMHVAADVVMLHKPLAQVLAEEGRPPAGTNLSFGLGSRFRLRQNPVGQLVMLGQLLGVFQVAEQQPSPDGFSPAGMGGKAR